MKHYCNVLSGYDVLTAGSQPHHGGQAGLLSGLPYIEIPGDGDVFASKYRGPSIDQIIAQELNVPSIALVFQSEYRKTMGLHSKRSRKKFG